MVNSTEVPKQQKTEAANKILKANEILEKESVIEQKIDTDCKDVEDSLAFIDGDSVYITALMKPDCSLENSPTTTKIKDIISLTAKVPASNIYLNEAQSKRSQ